MSSRDSVSTPVRPLKIAAVFRRPPPICAGRDIPAATFLQKTLTTQLFVFQLLNDRTKVKVARELGRLHRAVVRAEQPPLGE